MEKNQNGEDTPLGQRQKPEFNSTYLWIEQSKMFSPRKERNEATVHDNL